MSTGALGKVSLPFPLKTAAYLPPKLTFSTPYQETLTEPAGTLLQSAEFTTGVSAVSGVETALRIVIRVERGRIKTFTYTPKPGYISAGSDPEDGTPDDRFTYQLTGPNGTSTNAVVEIIVAAPAPPLVDTDTSTNVTATTATLGGDVSSDGGAPIIAIGVVYAPTSVNNNPQIGGAGVSAATGTGATGVFTVNVTNLAPDTDYSFAAYATNSVGLTYSGIGYFTTAATFLSWQQSWFGDPSSSAAAYGADPYNTGVRNFAVFAFLGPYQDPSTANPAQLPQIQISGGNLFYSFTEPMGVSGVTYGAQWSATLQPNDWHPVADTGAPSATPPDHLFSVPMTGPQLFMRLTVSFH